MQSLASHSELSKIFNAVDETEMGPIFQVTKATAEARN